MIWISVRIISPFLTNVFKRNLFDAKYTRPGINFFNFIAVSGLCPAGRVTGLPEYSRGSRTAIHIAFLAQS